MSACPRCGSSHVASRRALFRCLATEAGVERGFEWYDLAEEGACPPKSLFVVLLTLLLVLALPAALLWALDVYPALPWLGAAAPLLFSTLVLDARLTYRRYRDWASHWRCGACRHSFQP